MPSYTVDCFNYDGKWSPKDGVHKLQTFLSAAVETFEARLQGKRSRIVIWPNGDTLVTVPPAALYVSPQNVYGQLGALRKLASVL